MNRIRMALLALSLGLLSGNAFAQDTRWQASSTAPAVALGRPTPLTELVSASPFTPAPSVVRGYRPDEYAKQSMTRAPQDFSIPPAAPIPMPFSFLPEVDLPRNPARSKSAPSNPMPPIIDVDKEGKSQVQQTQQPEQIKSQPKKVDPSAQPQPQPRIGTVEMEPELRFIEEDFWSEMTPTPRIYLRGEYLYWASKGMNTPVLVTTAPSNVSQANAGVLGQPTTSTLFGGGRVLDGWSSGARITLGVNCDPYGLDAWEATFFFLGPQQQNAVFTSNQFPVLARPFFNANLGVQDRELTTFPNNGAPFAGTGNVGVDLSTSLLGAELNRKWLCLCGDDCRVSTLVGFRYLDLTDRLRITENTLVLKPINDLNNQLLFNAGDRFFLFDSFNTQNRFFGGQFGVEGELRRGALSFNAVVKVALGATCQNVDIAGGQQKTSGNGAVQNFNGGLFALSSNIGSHRQTQFAVAPEAGLKIGYDLNDNVRVFVGYNFLYWSNVLRAADQIDTTIDVKLVPNSGVGNNFRSAPEVRPRVPLVTSSYWAHGVNAGLEVRY